MSDNTKNTNSAFDPMEKKANSIEHDSSKIEDMPQVDSEKKSKTVNKLIVAIVIFILLVLLFACAVIFANRYKEQKAIEKAEAQKTAQKKESSSIEAGNNIAEDKAKAKLAELAEQEAAKQKSLVASDPQASQKQAPITVSDTNNKATNNQNYVKNTATENQNSVVPAQAKNYQSVQNQAQADERDSKLEGDVLAYSGSGKRGNENNALLGADSSDDNNEQPRNSDSKNTFANQYVSTKFSGSIASQRKDYTMLLRQGTIIPCVLLTRIDSTYAGQTACQVTKDVYSANGRTLLLERGSKMIGEQRVQLMQGQARVFVLWSQLETPNGIQVQLDSGSTDSLGASGISARVNSHYLKRFGSSILLSLIEDFSSNLTKNNNNGSNSNGGVTYNSTSDTANEIAVEALKNSINIPPTATVNQGSLLNVFVARDVDFRKVYELTNRN